MVLRSFLDPSPAFEKYIIIRQNKIKITVEKKMATKDEKKTGV